MGCAGVLRRGIQPGNVRPEHRPQSQGGAIARHGIRGLAKDRFVCALVGFRAARQRRRTLVQALNPDTHGRRIHRHHGGRSRRAGGNARFHHDLKKVLGIARVQDQDLHRVRSVSAHGVLRGGQRRVGGKVAAQADKLCLRRVFQRRASARNLKIRTEGRLALHKSQSSVNDLLLFFTGRADVQIIHLHLRLRGRGLRRRRRLLLGLSSSGQQNSDG